MKRKFEAVKSVAVPIMVCFVLMLLSSCSAAAIKDAANVAEQQKGITDIAGKYIYAFNDVANNIGFFKGLIDFFVGFFIVLIFCALVVAIPFGMLISIEKKQSESIAKGREEYYDKLDGEVGVKIGSFIFVISWIIPILQLVFMFDIHGFFRVCFAYLFLVCCDMCILAVPAMPLSQVYGALILPARVRKAGRIVGKKFTSKAVYEICNEMKAFTRDVFFSHIGIKQESPIGFWINVALDNVLNAYSFYCIAIETTKTSSAGKTYTITTRYYQTKAQFAIMVDEVGQWLDANGARNSSDVKNGLSYSDSAAQFIYSAGVELSEQGKVDIIDTGSNIDGPTKQSPKVFSPKARPMVSIELDID